MKKAKSSKIAPKRVKNSPWRTRHSAQQHAKPLTGRVGPAQVTAKGSANRETKHDKVLAMLRSKQALQ